MVFTTADTRQKNGVEVITFDNKKWLNKTHIKEQLEHSNLREITSKYPEHLGKRRSELQECNKQPCRIFLREYFAIQIIMDCKQHLH